MYNLIQKWNFIRDYTSSQSTQDDVSRIFTRLQKYEDALGKDFCEFSIEEAADVLDKSAALKTASQWSSVSALKAYAKWCTEHKIPNANEKLASSITLKNDAGLDKIRNCMITGPAHLQMYLDSVFDKESEQTIDNIYRAFYWMAFSGINDEDALNIKTKDVDFDDMVIHYGDVCVPIYREAIHCFRNLCTLTQFNYRHPNYSKEIKRDRIISDNLLRGVKAEQKMQTIRSIISKKEKTAIKKGLTPLNLSYSRIQLSGSFFRAYENERMGIAPAFIEETALRMKGKEYSLSNRMELSHIANKIAKEFREDYARWKMAFSI